MALSFSFPFWSHSLSSGPEGETAGEEEDSYWSPRLARPYREGFKHMNSLGDLVYIAQLIGVF